MKTFYLQREKPYPALYTGQMGLLSDPLIKTGTRHLLAMSAQRELLLHGQPVYPKFIDARMHFGCEKMGTVSADHWLAAKKQLGYPLTTKQEVALTAFRSKKLLEQRRAA